MTTTITKLAEDLGIPRRKVQQIIQKKMKKKPNKDETGRYCLSEKDVEEIKQFIEIPKDNNTSSTDSELKKKEKEILDLKQELDQAKRALMAQADELKQIQDQQVKLQNQIKDLKSRTLWKRIRNV